MLMEMLGYTMMAGTLAGKGAVAQISLKWRLAGFIMLLFTGLYWAWRCVGLKQWDMVSLQLIMLTANVWGVYNCVQAIHEGKR